MWVAILEDDRRTHPDAKFVMAQRSTRSYTFGGAGQRAPERLRAPRPFCSRQFPPVTRMQGPAGCRKAKAGEKLSISHRKCLFCATGWSGNLLTHVGEDLDQWSRDLLPEADQSVHRLQTWKLTVAYDGTGFSGWQVQPGETTVQGELQAAL